MSVEFRTSEGVLRAVEALSFSIEPGETVALVGESGCGKSTAALAVLRLIASPPGRISAGQVLFDGRDLLALSDADMRAVRGSEIAMVFQDPAMYLNPVHSIGRQIGEGLRLHKGLDRNAALREAIDLLGLVGVPAPAERVHEYPHNLSGGMRQRVMIAMALACRPRLLIADEPTTALDVTVQAQVLELIRELKVRLGMAVLLITHDLGVVAETADRVVVMYAGRKVEEGPVAELFRDPHHPYTHGLTEAARWNLRGDGTFAEIAGTVPSPLSLPPGCSFAPRCGRAMERCTMQRPVSIEFAARRNAECFLAGVEP
ncbi:MAG: ABC transporter ATP-binding protein [Betaproteobacteria bacterium]|nr:ABC transporter ATP-binding protein [Betaproteobacteria bacterium]